MAFSTSQIFLFIIPVSKVRDYEDQQADMGYSFKRRYVREILLRRWAGRCSQMVSYHGGGRPSVAMKQSIVSMRRIIYQKADEKFICLIITMHQQFWTMSTIKYPLLFTNAWLLFLAYTNIFGPCSIRWPSLGSQAFLLSFDSETSFICQVFSVKEGSCLVRGILFK